MINDGASWTIISTGKKLGRCSENTWKGLGVVIKEMPNCFMVYMWYSRIMLAKRIYVTLWFRVRFRHFFPKRFLPIVTETICFLSRPSGVHLLRRNGPHILSYHSSAGGLKTWIEWRRWRGDVGTDRAELYGKLESLVWGCRSRYKL